MIEYNCRFGDPEAQTILPLMESSLLDAMLACEYGTLDKTLVVFSDKASANVVLVSGGYPGKYEKGLPIAFGELDEGVSVVHAGTKKAENGFVTAGGRVLNVVAVRDDLNSAVEAAYANAERISFPGMFMRRDIGKTALDYIKG